MEEEDWLIAARSGELSWTELAERLLANEHAAGSEHRPDFDRQRRCGFGEVIFGERKTSEGIVRIAQQLLERGQPEVLATRVSREHVPYISESFAWIRYDSLGRTLRMANEVPGVVAARASTSSPPALPRSEVWVVTAGSTDLPVAREALETLGGRGVPAGLITDVGVAGPYRLLTHLGRLRAAKVLVVVAGMEGALASVAGGLVPCPIIAVPTSVGYGANLEGITTLLSMMSSCAAGVTVVNIDAGFKGGYVAGLIANEHDQLR